MIFMKLTINRNSAYNNCDCFKIKDAIHEEPWQFIHSFSVQIKKQNYENMDRIVICAAFLQIKNIYVFLSIVCNL